MYILYEATCRSCDLSVTIGLTGRIDPMQEDIAGDVITCPVCCSGDLGGFGVYNRKVVDKEQWEEEAREHLNNDKVVAAIKVCREHTGRSLRDAKALVESMPEYADYRKRHDP